MQDRHFSIQPQDGWFSDDDTEVADARKIYAWYSPAGSS